MKNPFDSIKEPVPTIGNRPHPICKPGPDDVEIIIDDKKYYYNEKVLLADMEWREKRSQEILAMGMAGALAAQKKFEDEK